VPRRDGLVQKPRRYVFRVELPKNSYGKILKTELRSLARQPGGIPD